MLSAVGPSITSTITRNSPTRMQSIKSDLNRRLPNPVLKRTGGAANRVISKLPVALRPLKSCCRGSRGAVEQTTTQIAATRCTEQCWLEPWPVRKGRPAKLQA